MCYRPSVARFPDPSLSSPPDVSPASTLTDDPLEAQVVRSVVADALLTQPFEPQDGNQFVAYTDGSCLRNPDGPSGFAAVVQASF